MAEVFEERLAIADAHAVISGRLSDGWVLLGLEGMWVRPGEVEPDLGFIFDGSPDGVTDQREVEELVAGWPRSELFHVEVLMTR